MRRLLCSDLFDRRLRTHRPSGERDRFYRTDPGRIAHKLAPFTHGILHDAFEASYLLPGIWDRFVVPYPWHPVVVQRLIAQGFEPPPNRSRTPAERRRDLDRVRRRRYASAEHRRRRVASIDAAIADIIESGYRDQEEPPNLHDEIGVLITRDGRLVWSRQGDHRLTIAQALNLPRVPVIVRGVHLDFAWKAIAAAPDLEPEAALDQGLQRVGLHAADLPSGHTWPLGPLKERGQPR